MLTKIANTSFANDIFPKQIESLRNFAKSEIYGLEGIDLIKVQLMHLAIIDQFVLATPDDSDLVKATIKEVLQKNTDSLKNILSQIDEGWPVRSKFGNQNGCKSSDAAFLIAQHSDFDIEFQKSVLQTLETLKCRNNERPEYCPANLAYLHDRIQTNMGLPQKYGTQGTKENGIWFPNTCETSNIEEINKLRKSIRMAEGSLENYFEHMNEDIPVKTLPAIRFVDVTTPHEALPSHQFK